MTERSQRLRAATQILIQHSLAPLLLKKLDVHLSQNETDALASEVSSEVADHMLNDINIVQILNENELRDPKGNLNCPAVAECLQEMATKLSKAGKQQQLQHLLHHFISTMKDLRFMKEIVSDGRPEQP